MRVAFTTVITVDPVVAQRYVDRITEAGLIGDLDGIHRFAIAEGWDPEQLHAALEAPQMFGPPVSTPDARHISHSGPAPSGGVGAGAAEQTIGEAS